MAVYCAQCGKESAVDARFCSACGRPLIPGAVAGGAAWRTTAPLGALVRPRLGRKVAGVCQGLANLYGWDASVVRVVALLLAVFTFPIGVIAYGMAWLIAPEEPLSLPGSTYAGQG